MEFSPPSNRHYQILSLPSLEERGVDATALHAIFEQTGVVILPGFFSHAELEPARQAMAEHYAPLQEKALSLTCSNSREGERQFDCDVIPWEPVKEGNAIMQELHHHSGLAAVTEAALGPGFTAPGSLVMFSIGGGLGQAWHQDCPPGNSEAFNLNRLIYTDDVSLEDGAIVFVPGSHRLGRIPPGGHQEAMDGEVFLTPKAGTLVLLHGHVYHRVTPNLNSKPRVSINFRAFAAGVSPDVTCIGIYRNGSVNFCDKPKHHDGTPAETLPA